MQLEESKYQDQFFVEGLHFTEQDVNSLEENQMTQARRKEKYLQKLKEERETPVHYHEPILEVELYLPNKLHFLSVDSEGLCSIPAMVTRKFFYEPSLFNYKLTQEDMQVMESLPAKARKFYPKREFLFSQFNKGIQLDEESWYSVLPECIGKHIAERVQRKNKQSKSKFSLIVDPFCGSGGLAIQLAKQFKNVRAFDIDNMQIYPQKLFFSKVQNLKHNMKLYDVEFPVEQMDFFDLQPIDILDFQQWDLFDDNPEGQTLLFLCPPWGGPDYKYKKYFDLETDMKPNLYDLVQQATFLSGSWCIQLPKNIKMEQLSEILCKSLVWNLIRFSVEIELIYINSQLNMIFLYYGNISSIKFYQEINFLHQTITIGMTLDKLRYRRIKRTLRKVIKKHGMKRFLDDLNKMIKSQQGQPKEQQEQLSEESLHEPKQEPPQQLQQNNVGSDHQLQQ